MHVEFTADSTIIVTALASPDGAQHEDSTQPPLSSGNEAGWGTEGITHPTDAPGGEVLHGLNPASTNEAGDDSLLTGTSKNNGSYSFLTCCVK